MQVREIRTIDLFAGIGGFHVGLTEANRIVSRENSKEDAPVERAVGDRLWDGRAISNDIREGEGEDRRERADHRYQFKFLWASEWDKYASSVYRARFPETQLDTRDIRTVPVEQVPQHDLLCGGFPCQAFSVAGRREGFNDTRGTLFREIARIAEYHRPQLLLLENVKGLLNHDGGRTFKVILEELGNIGYRLEWQVLNTKWTGVPQNRERVFIVGHLGKGCPRAIFPITDFNELPIEELEGGEGVASCLDANYFKGARRQRTYVGLTEPEDGTLAISSTNPSKPDEKREYHFAEEVRTLPASNAGNNNPVVVHPVLTPDRAKKRQNGRRFKDDGEESFTLTGQDIHGVMIEEKQKDDPVFLHNIYGGWGENIRESKNVSPTIRTPAGGGHLPVVANCLDQDGYLRNGARPRDEQGKAQLLPIGYRRIRRLTPVECERLQAFPDNWTATGLVDGKLIEISDTQRYKQCGNAVTTRVVTHIGLRLLHSLDAVIPIVPETVDDWFG